MPNDKNALTIARDLATSTAASRGCTRPALTDPAMSAKPSAGGLGSEQPELLAPCGELVHCVTITGERQLTESMGSIRPDRQSDRSPGSPLDGVADVVGLAAGVEVVRVRATPDIASVSDHGLVGRAAVSEERPAVSGDNGVAGRSPAAVATLRF